MSLPDNVKAVISRLSVQDQVVIRSYIAGMRDELKELKVKLEHANDDDDDSHAHFHGHEVSRVLATYGFILHSYEIIMFVHIIFLFMQHITTSNYCRNALRIMDIKNMITRKKIITVMITTGKR